MKYILNNIDDGQISMMTSFRKKISNTFIFAGLWHKIIQNDQIPLRYVQVTSVVDIVVDIPGIVPNISKQDGCH
jgi:hypothetical protein